MKQCLTYVLATLAVVSVAQPSIELDANSFYQMVVTNASEDDGGKIYLQNLNLTPHLSMGSTNINFDVGPFISRTKEHPLVFMAEESVQMELKADGDLKVGNLAGLGDRPLFTTSDGTIKAVSTEPPSTDQKRNGSVDLDSQRLHFQRIGRSSTHQLRDCQKSSM